jgi:hypothetical protein
MTDYNTMPVEQLAQGIAQTRAAIKRGEELIEKIGREGAQKPKVWASLAESTDRLRTHLEADLAALEKALDKALQA